MPGLLQTGNSLASLKFLAAFLAELIGVLLFTLYGSVAGRGDYAAWGNGIALAVLGMPPTPTDLPVAVNRACVADHLRHFVQRSIRNCKRLWRPSQSCCDDRHYDQWPYRPSGRDFIPHSTDFRGLLGHPS